MRGVFGFNKVLNNIEIVREATVIKLSEQEEGAGDVFFVRYRYTLLAKLKSKGGNGNLLN